MWYVPYTYYCMWYKYMYGTEPYCNMMCKSSLIQAILQVCALTASGNNVLHKQMYWIEKNVISDYICIEYFTCIPIWFFINIGNTLTPEGCTWTFVYALKPCSKAAMH